MMVGKRVGWVMALVVAVGGTVFAQTTRPGGMGAGAQPEVAESRPAAVVGAATKPADYSTPRAAVVSFLRANDEQSLRGALLVPEGAKREVEAFLGVMISTMALQKEATAQYGTAAAQYFSKATDAQIERRVKAAEGAQVTMKGEDAATVQLPADEEAKQAAGTIELKRVGGEWKIDAASMFGVGTVPAEVTAKRVALAEGLKRVTDGMVKDMGKYLSAGDAYQEYWNRSRVEMEKVTGKAGGGAAATRP